MRGTAPLWAALALAAVLGPLATSCGETFDPRTLVTEPRVLAIQATPADLAQGEVAALRALVAAPDGEEVAYHWEWCPVTAGPDNGYACLTEGLGLDPATLALFDLGDGPTATLPYPGDAESLQALCQEILDELQTLPDFAELPNCDLGTDVFVRLTVRAGELEKVALKRIFLWFDPDPDPRQRNTNPEVDRVLSGPSAIREDFALRVAPGEAVPWFVYLSPDNKEQFLPREEGAEELREEEILFSWFSTTGDWDRERSYSDATDFTLQQAGRNTLFVPGDAEPGTAASVFFVVRDGRGGQGWTQRDLQIVAPSGGEASQ